MSLAILHRQPQPELNPPDVVVWRTCLREVVFFDDRDGAAAPVETGERLFDGRAYRLLLEIICGLRSPMIGETQVMGQFKAFLSRAGGQHPWLSHVGQRLLADAREVRARHLQGLGSRSYGSAVRRDLVDCRLSVVIGTGKLAREVLPFLGEDGRRVHQWARTAPELAPTQDVEQRLLERADDYGVTDLPAALVIAAPVSTTTAQDVAARYRNIRRVIDLRAESGDEPIRVAAEVITLQDLFSRTQIASAAAEVRIKAALAEIASRSQRYEMRDELRPFGWDDLW